jgi:hypothetical protein
MIPKKLAPGLDPGVGTGFRKRSCSSKEHDAEKACPGLDPGGNRFSEKIMLA